MGNNKTKQLVFLGLNTALVCVGTLISIPSGLGYKNLGDVFVIFAALFFGPYAGAISGGIGAALSDAILGYYNYVPFTLVIKAIEGLVAGLLFRLLSRVKFNYYASVIVSSVPAACLMALGYFATNYILYREIAAAVVGLWGDFVQGAVGVVGGSALIFALGKINGIESVCGSSSGSLYRRYACRGGIHKKAVIISDLSGLGRCSLSAQTSIISAAGHEPVCLPTAVLSAQTGFEGYRILSTPSALDEFPAHWDELGLRPDALLTGYIADVEQIAKITAIAEHYKNAGAMIVVDPIMGDDGKLYNGFSQETTNALAKLCDIASVITPNLTEACLLAGANYDEIIAKSDKKALFEAVFALGEKLRANSENPTPSNKKVVITGVRFGKKIYNFVLDGKHKCVGSFYRNKSYSGTGDILSAVVAGMTMNGLSLTRSVKKAARLISHAIADTELEGSLPVEGINYQKFLYLL